MQLRADMLVAQAVLRVSRAIVKIAPGKQRLDLDLG